MCRLWSWCELCLVILTIINIKLNEKISLFVSPLMITLALSEINLPTLFSSSISHKHAPQISLEFCSSCLRRGLKQVCKELCIKTDYSKVSLYDLDIYHVELGLIPMLTCVNFPKGLLISLSSNTTSCTHLN